MSGTSVRGRGAGLWTGGVEIERGTLGLETGFCALFATGRVAARRGDAADFGAAALTLGLASRRVEGREAVAGRALRLAAVGFGGLVAVDARRAGFLAPVALDRAVLRFAAGAARFFAAAAERFFAVGAARFFAVGAVRFFAVGAVRFFAVGAVRFFAVGAMRFFAAGAVRFFAAEIALFFGAGVARLFDLAAAAACFGFLLAAARTVFVLLDFLVVGR